MFSHPPYQQFPSSFTTFASQKIMFSTTSNIFGISTMTLLSTFCPLLPSHCYRPPLSSQRFDTPPHLNQPQLTEDDPEPTEPGSPQRPQRQRRRPSCDTSSHRQSLFLFLFKTIIFLIKFILRYYFILISIYLIILFFPNYNNTNHNIIQK